MDILLIIILVCIAQLLFGIFWGKFIRFGSIDINNVDDYLKKECSQLED